MQIKFIKFLALGLLVWGCVKKECVPVPTTDSLEKPLGGTLDDPPPLVLKSALLQSKEVIEDAEVVGYIPNRDINYDSSTSLYTESPYDIKQGYYDVNGFIKFKYPEVLTEDNKIKIKSAKLTLYSKPSIIDHSIRLMLKKVSGPWSASTLSYNNQPSVSEKNKVIINLENGIEDTVIFDVTEIVKDQIKTSNNGFFLGLSTYSSSTSIHFFSSEWEFPDKYPKLEIEYWE